MADTYDLIVIGGGPAGYLAAERAGEAGLSVALFEKRALGGVCLNEGCIPTKTFLNSAKIYAHALHGEAYGVSADGLRLDHAAVLKRKADVVAKLVGGVTYTLKEKKVTVIEAEARIEGKAEGGFAVSGGGAEAVAPKLIIAAGSKPIVPPIPGVAEGVEAGYVYTSREILDIGHVPESLIIVGGGVIGLEMADYFAVAGAKVTVVEMLDKIAGPFDRDISQILKKNLEAKGVAFLLGAKVTAVSKGGVKAEVNGEAVDVPGEAVLLSIGRRPAPEGLSLEKIGVLVENGAVVTGTHLQTNVPGVYAAGDINGKIMLAHTAYREAEVAVNHIIGKPDDMKYDAIPSVIYTQPEAAYVGETEETAAAKGLRVTVKKLPMMYSGRYVAENDGGDGICKLLIDDSAGRIVGAGLIGGYASETILSATALIGLGIPIESAKRIVFPHPTVGEIIRETLFS
ncbi:MAG: dihydrolipoyl dehydrogenase [Clostridiales Family XIII bacterium]|jgi:dihydrolipoamide dehydrogenase|nr:dihydrolipoyl dehydrogenase [Clostridiales Family XIII bacterium]